MEGKEERGGEQVEGKGGRGLGRTDSCRVDGAAWTSQGMGSRKGKDLWKDTSTCSSFLERRKEDKKVSGGGKEGEGRAGRGGIGKRREGIGQD